MKYIEELSVGDAFVFQDQIYILTSDFKKNGDKSCVNLKNGLSRWLSSQETVEISPIYTLDQDNTIIPVKPVLTNEPPKNIS